MTKVTARDVKPPVGNPYTKSKLLLAAACAVSLSLNALAATWNITADRVLTESDQAEINTLESITITGGKCLSVAAGNTVTIPCPISSTGAPLLGKPSTGTLIIANAINSSVTKNTDLPCYGAVMFAEGASIGNSYLNIATGDNSPSSIVTFDTVFPSGGGPARFQTRGYTAFAFGKANVFANSSATTPNMIIGRASNPAGILDLNGYDQSVPTVTFTAPSNQEAIERYREVNYFTSDTAAMLTVTRAFAGTGIFNGRLLGGLSFKLASTTGGMASFSNILAQVSSTTGSLICAAGTIRLLDGARFDSLTSIRKEGTGNFVISTPVINATVDLYLDGTGKVTLNNDIIVAHAYTNDTNGGWVILKADEYDAAKLGAHLVGSGKVTVLYDDTAVGDTTYTWTGALGNGTLSDGGNWEGGAAPTLESVGERLVFPVTGTSSCRVDGTITVGGIEIAYPGAFTVEAGTGAQILLGEGGLSVADTTAQTNTVTLAAPISLLPGVSDVTFAVADGTALNIAGGISATAANGRRLVIDGGALTLGGDSSAMLLEMAITNATSVTVTSASGLGAGGATIYGEMVPYFDGTRRCTSPWSVIGPFAGENKFRYLYPAVTDSPFEFTGEVSFTGTCQSDGKYTGYVVLIIRNDTIFRGGIAVEHLARLELNYGGKSNSVYILDHPVVRGLKSSSDYVDVRFYGSSATNSFVVTDQDVGGSVAKGVYVSQCSLVCIADNCVNGLFMPYVNSRDPSNGDPIWGKFDLNGHNQTFKRILSDSNIAGGKYPMYPDSYVEIASETPATLTFGEKNTYIDLHQMKFTGAVSLRTADPWVGTIRITNTVSTTTGDLEVTAGAIEFLKDAGWGGGTNVTVNGLSTNAVLRMSAGTKGFSPVGGGASKVELKLAGLGSLDIPDAGTVVSVRTCETNGVRLSRGDYTAATLPGFLTGAGTLHVRMKYANGTLFCVR